MEQLLHETENKVRVGNSKEYSSHILPSPEFKSKLT